ncbi:uncharacterized protein YbjT (DUF2867 family) [Salinibacter ruber]|uniref:Uncharacterized protein YbjT (DUF2867 family) n=1 Tax=Salinibacter ruber TaxID=146919 RepID=A0A9X2Q0S4_9BACT|nr:NAD(P)H-binding protein [Salinibacter ruber]MCS3676285.1 uncharacterized protein YbjT (DUF2867 family) [Salinibacter ruber]MCS3679572.1 uncharacterized protein YbjT (DUF2867 family) [Salinibacter ruber]MCS4178632.1 uncharacterized protein YbjT (DUF2867 family) [Salinibacter ruber]
MKLAVFGATGGTGRQFIAQATEAGHRIRALTRSPEKLSGRDAVVPVEGNVLDPDDARRPVEGTDAAVCILGRTKNNPADVVSQGTAHILDAMQRYDVRRLVVVTSIGLGASVTNLPWYGRLANATVLQDLMADKARQEELVMQSRLDWTIVRPGGLTDGSRTGDYVHGADLDAEAAPIPRADVADFLLTVLERDLYVRKAPLVTTREGVDLAFLWQQMRDVTTRLLWGA